MISYELAKKLKDAGFPVPDVREGVHKQFLTPEPVLVPTLSELIAACGEEFSYLVAFFTKQDGEEKITSWRAVGFQKIGDRRSEDGTTKEEAVANLWLALQV